MELMGIKVTGVAPVPTDELWPLMRGPASNATGKSSSHS
jgi:hypothetical protein